MGETDSNIYVELSKQSHNSFEKEQYIWWTNSICLWALLKNYSGQYNWVEYWPQSSQVDHWNRTESLDMDLHIWYIYYKLISTRIPGQFSGEKVLTNGARTIGNMLMEKMNFLFYFTT